MVIHLNAARSTLAIGYAGYLSFWNLSSLILVSQMLCCAFPCCLDIVCSLPGSTGQSVRVLYVEHIGLINLKAASSTLAVGYGDLENVVFPRLAGL